jgi:hypothetical protein
MDTRKGEAGVRLMTREAPSCEADMVELSLLLPDWQLSQLEMAARGQGLTVGQMVRRLIRAFLHEPA